MPGFELKTLKGKEIGSTAIMKQNKNVLKKANLKTITPAYTHRK